jgi:hypothetical protein
MTAEIAGDLILGLLAGMALGWVHLLLLRRASASVVTRSGGTGALLGGAALRVAIVLAGFAAVAWTTSQPGLALIAALGGFALARTFVLWRTQRIER